MTASVYDSERLAAAYASDRPPVHEHILRSAVRLFHRRLLRGRRRARALVRVVRAALPVAAGLAGGSFQAWTWTGSTRIASRVTWRA